ncbi:hypothetical protein MUN84_20585 [Hymenobacter sp. 5516J-16]|uniref:hypothetical protein n=1 Tax=Hymenobacter sp. 5516J-16 TaxID=2932253 RepID=UPI001FD4AA73|nr:hypothetical protein [Hymenobacter sp. 5516J-16]UOQ76862.1 hypothetical protein MUN84_20585 [Hymenobacter sp. 5516J-16]
MRIEFREGEAILPDLDRIEELINRSNQLNFTKRRVRKEEVQASLEDPARRWGTVRVHDRFGDYGLVGVYCLNTETEQLEQLVFSCRILHLGVEQFTYAYLGFPALEVQGEVATHLNTTESPDWITIVDPTNAPKVAASSGVDVTAPAEARLRVLLKGGCDLGQLTPFLQAFELDVVEEFNYNNENQIPVHLEHTALLRAGREWPAAEQQRLAAALPFLGRESFETQLWQASYDVLVYSPLMDYTQELYREKVTGRAIPFGGYQNLTAVEPAAQAAKYTQRRFQGMSEDFLRQFQQEFELVGQITPAQFTENLQWLRAQVPAQVPIFFLNGAEIDVPSSSETGAAERHIVLNRALAAFAAAAPNCYVLDVRDFIRTPADVTNNLRHYHRQHYRTLAQRLATAIGEWRGQHLAHSSWTDLKARAASLVPGKLRGLFK